MAFAGTMTEMIVLFRADTGRSQTTDISDSDITDRINDYYVNRFPAHAKVDEFDDFFTQALSATDTGIYAVAQNVDRLDDPITINGNQILLCRNREIFFSGQGGLGLPVASNAFPPFDNFGLGRFEDEQFITDPTLSIGTDATKVLHAAFTYRIVGFSYSKASSEVDLTGDTVPQNKYGAWSLKIDTDGTITVAEADDNTTGYDTPRLALEALDSSDSESAYMGYVTVIETASAGFIPGTTSLATGGTVTATYTDGRFENRGTPIVALLYGQNLYVRPKANDIFELKALTIADRPTALGASDAPPDIKWAPAIARGAVIEYLEPKAGQQRIADLAITTKDMFDEIRMDKYKRLKNRILQATF